jgi:predicted DCC family thiol-disulfide oxidoreductase YuxK
MTDDNPSALGSDPPITVYFDGSCPLCTQEVSWYKKTNAPIVWVDVSGAGDPAPDLGREAALARFHVRGKDAQLVSGGRAFLLVWAQIPMLRPIAWILGRPPLVWLLEPAYALFLKVRPGLQRFAGGAGRR